MAILDFVFGRYCRIINHNECGITFEVNKHLPKPKQSLYRLEGKALEDKVIESVYRWEEELENTCITSSFRNKTLAWVGADTLYKCIIDAYADHRPLILSPDVIWLVICQAISYQINKDPKKYRKVLVRHKGKKKLVIESHTDLLNENTDWEEVLRNFCESITSNSRYEALNDMIANFSTTDTTEKIASRITMMHTVKK